LAESEQRGALRERQRTLVRLLRHKFPEASDRVVQRIESVGDPERLDEWLDHLLDADSLAAVESILEAESALER
jgi:hypothetical protein